MIYKPNWLVKPTHGCNLNCKYCYDADMRKKYGDVVMDDEIFRKIVDLNKIYSHEFIFHGGEPLYMGKEWYRRNLPYLHTAFGDRIGLSLQSNGSLLDDEWRGIFAEYKIKVGVSYDYTSQNLLRGNTSPKVQAAGKMYGSICVVTKQNIDSLIEIYNEGNRQSNGFSGVTFNFLFQTDRSETNNLDILPVSDILRGFGNFFSYYINTPEATHAERTSQTIIQSLFGAGNNVCTTADCRVAWVCVNPVGDIYPCDRYYGEEYCYGNIMDMNSINDFTKTEGFKRYYKDVQQRIINICSRCEYFPVCKGGCNGCHLIGAGSLTKTDQNICREKRAMSALGYDQMRTFDIYSQKVSSLVRKTISDSGGITLNEIYEYLHSIGYRSSLQYGGMADSYTDSIEYRVFRAFNKYTETQNRSQSEEYHGHIHDLQAFREMRVKYISKIYDVHKDEINRLLITNSALTGKETKYD